MRRPGTRLFDLPSGGNLVGRIQTEANPALAILAGSLGDALRMHAAQRAHYFFFFLFCHKALSDRLRDVHGMTLGNADGVSAKATHQIATGMRSGDGAYYDFLDQDASIVDRAATACGSSDAAHYCNLGVTPAFVSNANTFARPDVDPIAFKLREMLEVMAGATRQLPQRVNIGPDRIVDQAHGRLAFAFLNGTPPMTAANYRTYLDTCAGAMATYRNTHASKGNHGLAACCDCYLDFYGGAAACSKPWTREGVWQMLCSQIDAECGGLGLDRSRYVSMAVH
jgi:hypothetical protein